MQKSPSPYIQHIVDAATQIAEYLNLANESEFRNNRMAQDAIVRQLEVIGEACTKLEKNFHHSHQHIPWSQIIGMRNKLAHEYWDVDTDTVWLTATKDVPRLRIQLLELLNQLGK